MGTAAKIPEIERIFWFDLDNGIETLLYSGLTAEQMEKIIVFKIPDSRDNPVGIETVLKSFTSKTGVKICDAHGKVNCQDCAKKGEPTQEFKLSDCTSKDLVVIDSGSALGDSALGAACLGQDIMFKPGWDEYGVVGKYLGDILSIVQAAKNTNFVVITHELSVEDETTKVSRIYPLMGTKPFSMKVAKYFGTVVYVHKKMNKHVAGSSSVYRGDVLTGSRVNAAIEKSATMEMSAILGVRANQALDSDPPPESKAPVTPQIAKPAMGLAAMLASKKAAS